MTWNATTPTTAFASALAGDAAVRRAEMPQAEQHVQPHEDHGMQDVAAEEHHEPRQRTDHDELRADACRPRNPTSVFASPPMPMMPLDSASCTSPATVPASSPVGGAR